MIFSMLFIADIPDNIIVEREIESFDAYLDNFYKWRTIVMVLRHDETEFKCPYLKDTECGGAWVTLEYCASHCKGAGCSKKQTCRARLKHIENTPMIALPVVMDVTG